MLLRFLGTSAGELYPGLWCRCSHCQRARTGESKNRRQSAALYVEPNDPASASERDSRRGVLIDFPSEIASQAHTHRVDLPGLQYLLVTHSHGDHWFPYLLRWRGCPPELCRSDEVAPRQFGGPRFTELPTLHVWGNAAVEAVLRRELGDDLTALALEFHRVGPGDEFSVGDLRATALPANHDVGREDAIHYVLTGSERTILYGLDGDSFLPPTREALRSFRFDLVILEATYGFGNGKNHRNFARLIDEATWFRKEGLMASGGRIVATHFSPHHCPPHEETAAFLQQHDIIAAWDGMEIRL